MKSYNLKGGSVAWFPEKICFTRQRNTHVWLYVNYIDPAFRPDVHATLTISFEGHSVQLRREVPGLDSKIVFPLTRILEALIGSTDANYINHVSLSLKYLNDTVNVNLDTVIHGSSEMEISPITEQAIPNNKPAPPVIVLYPSYDITQSIFVPELSTADYVLLEGTPSGALYYEDTGGNPFIPIASKNAVDGDAGIEITCYAGGVTSGSFIQKTLVDRCTDGVLIRWLDKHSIPCFYRWSVESISDEMTVENTYTQLDGILQPFAVQNKTVARTYKLHSRMVERDIFNLCKSILGGREIFMLNPETNSWERCYLEEGESTDSGSPMNDLVIDVAKYEYDL